MKIGPNRKSRIKLFRNPLTALALLYAVVLLGCAPEGTTRILSYHGLATDLLYVTQASISLPS